MKNLILLFSLLFPLFIDAQDIIFSVSGEYNEEKVAINAIHFENKSNGTGILFASLPDVDDYLINLTQEKYLGTTNIPAFELPSRFIVSQNIPGKLVVLYNWNQPADVRISVYNINGQKIFASGKKMLPGKNAIQIQLGLSQIYLVRFETEWEVRTFKALGTENRFGYAVKISDENNLTALKSNLIDSENEFDFDIGDSIRISAYKSGYYAAPVDLKVMDSQAVNFLFEESQNKSYLKINDDEYVLSGGLLTHFGNFEGNSSMYLLAPGHDINFETLETNGTDAVACFEIINKREDLISGIYYLSTPEEMNTDTVCDVDVNNDGLINEQDCVYKLPEGKFYISSLSSVYDSDANLYNFTGWEFQSGEVIITKDEDFFTVEIDCIGKNGDVITGFYSGQIHYYDALAEKKEITIDVIDVDSWSPVNPGGDYAANANVKLLDRNNPDKNFPLYEEMTDSNGKVIFNKVQQDGYFVYIEKGNQSNIIEKEIINGKEVGFIISGIFQSEEEVDQSVSLPGTSVGDPKLIDVNDDGILNADDKTVGYSITVYDNTAFTYYISGLDPSLLESETAINDTLLWCYSKLHKYIEYLYLFDAVYSNKFPAPDNSWTVIYNHEQTSSDNKIQRLWSEAYDIIYKSNLVIKSAERLITDPQTRNTSVAQAKMMRAYLFYNLLTWFGEIPIELGTSEGMIPRNTTEEVLEQIKLDAAEATKYLPEKWTGADLLRFPKSFARGLMARTLLFNKSYTEVLTPVQNIINIGIFTLDQDTINFSTMSTEIFCGFEKSGNTQFNNFFTKGSFVPLMRYTESILVYAEALFNAGNTENAMDIINLLNDRRDKPHVTSLSNDNIYQHWETELAKEGSMFITLKRYGKAKSVLLDLEYKFILPVPLSVLYNNPYLTQNPGY